MKATIEPTFAGSNTYRYMERPAVRGQLRLKRWAYQIAPESAADPMWVQRAIDYWKLQSETYGIKFDDDINLLVDYELGIVVTSARVVCMMPGIRTRDFVVPRVAEVSA
jgi:hypothetical protein